MNIKEKLLKRLGDIGKSLSNTPGALALLGLGSAGIETDRMDEYSDLDFFVICQKGTKEGLLEDVKWLISIHPVSYMFKNTRDGYKLLFEDGIFCEFAVFEPEELKDITFSEGRIVWKTEEFDSALCIPKALPKGKLPNTEWILGEALTNLYVGLGRYHRGEKLSAYYFIENFAMERVLQLMSLLEVPNMVPEDKFSIHRRFEFRYPNSSRALSKILGGYDNIISSAETILNFLDENFTINGAMKNKIMELCKQ